MNFIILASVLILSLVIFLAISRSKRLNGNAIEDFWKRERQANSTRRKPLDDLDYITIPFDTLPVEVMAEDEEIAECIRTLHTLSEGKIVNFTGITNTELKLRYGAPNITLLMNYDQSYTILARTLQRWADLLSRNNHPVEACQILEFAVSTRTDVTATYRLLCKLYKQLGCPEKIDSLYETAQSLQSSVKNTIVRILQESGQSPD